MAVNLSITLQPIFIYISYSYLQIECIDTINVPFCILQQLLKLAATNLNASMAWILSHPDKYPWYALIISQEATILATNSMSVSTGVQTQVTLDIPIENNEGNSGQLTSQAME